MNNDGVPELIENDVYQCSNHQPVFAVFIANGDGTFKAPVTYQYPAGFAGGPVAMAFGDFNGDGNMDMALISGDNAITPRRSYPFAY